MESNDVGIGTQTSAFENYHSAVEYANIIEKTAATKELVITPLATETLQTLRADIRLNTEWIAKLFDITDALKSDVRLNTEWIARLFDETGALNSTVKSLQSWKTEFVSQNSIRWSDQWAKNRVLDNRWSDQWDRNKTNDQYWKDSWANNLLLFENDSNFKQYWSDQWAKNKVLDNRWSDQWEKNRTNDGYWKDSWANNLLLFENDAKFKENWSDQWNHNKNLYAKDAEQQSEINALGTWKNVQLAWNVTQELGMADLQNQIDNLSFENGNFDDTGIINQLKEIEKAWYSNDYWTPTLLADDGGMVKLIKSQFQRLYELVFSFLNAFRNGGIFWLAWEANLPKLGELITECLDTSTPGTPLYAMRYSMTEGFMELQEAVEYATGKIRDNQVTEMTNQETMISALEEIRDHTAIVTQWLKLIYEKPTGSFIESPFDFDRLEEILGNLNFGNIVNEAGTNIWDFLSELISELGDVLGKGIDGVASVLGDILDFLDGFLDKIIHLIVPEDTSFLDTNFATIKGKFQAKFGSILELGGKVKDVFVPAKVDFFESTTFEIMGAKFRADKATADLFIPKFRVVMALFIWFEVAWFVYRKITGGGDMINDN